MGKSFLSGSGEEDVIPNGDELLLDTNSPESMDREGCPGRPGSEARLPGSNSDSTIHWDLRPVSVSISLAKKGRQYLPYEEVVGIQRM